MNSGALRGPFTRAILLLLLQCLIVASVAGKFLYERRTCPRVWVRARSVDPNLPLRGRYLWLPVEVNACGLIRHPDAETNISSLASLAVRDHQLVAWQRPNTPLYQLVPVEQPAGQPCQHASLEEGLLYFIPDSAAPLPALQEGRELWVEVTVPPAGPPRPIRLGIKENGRLTPLALR